MAVYKETIMLKSHGGTPTYVNITPQVREAIEKSGIKNGICVAISPYTTCSVFLKNLYMITMKQEMNFYRKI